MVIQRIAIARNGGGFRGWRGVDAEAHPLGQGNGPVMAGLHRGDRGAYGKDNSQGYCDLPLTVATVQGTTHSTEDGIGVGSVDRCFLHPCYQIVIFHIS